MKENEVIRVEDLDFTIETSKILSQVSLSVSKNEFVGLIGPNGSGKSTILKNIYRQYSPVLRGGLSERKRYLPDEVERGCSADGCRGTGKSAGF